MSNSLHVSTDGLESLARKLEEFLSDKFESDLIEANISLNSKLIDAEKAFLGSVALDIRKYLRKQDPKLKFEVNRFPPMGGGGNIGAVQVVGDEWKIDFVINRIREGGWELKKQGSMTVGRDTRRIKDKSKVSDLQSESLAMTASDYYSELVKKFEK